MGAKLIFIVEFSFTAAMLCTGWLKKEYTVWLACRNVLFESLDDYLHNYMEELFKFYWQWTSQIQNAGKSEHVLRNLAA